MQLLRTLVISAFHRFGLFEYLRDSWRADLGKKRDRWTAVEQGLGKVHRSVESIEQSLPSEVEQLHGRLRKLERSTRAIQEVIAIDQEQRARWHELEATLDETAIRSSVGRALAAASVSTVPMPHAVLRDFLPAATYAALLEAIPGDEFFPDKDPVKQNLKLQQLDIVPAWTRRALTYLETTIIGSILAPAVIARMQPHLEAIYREEYGPSLGPAVAALPHGPTAGRLMLRRPGYKLEPHLDPR